MVSFLFRRLTVEGLPLTLGSERIEVLIGVAVDTNSAGANDATQIQESLLIDLVLAEKTLVVTEITEKPAQLPKSLRSAVQPSGKSARLMSLGLQNGKLQHEK